MKTYTLQGGRWMLMVGSTIALLGCFDKTTRSNAASNVNPPAPAISTQAVELKKESLEENSAPQRALIPPAHLTPGVEELVKLIQSGVGEEVLLAFVDKSGRVFNPTVDEIVYLKDLGLAEPVLASLVSQRNAANNNPTQSVAPSPSELANNANADSSATSGPVAPSYSVESTPNNNEVSTAAPAQEVDMNYFEDTLSPYGNWVNVESYGRCWQPTVVVINRSWRPYGDRGRWMYTSSGWYWQSDYSWGWAPFHFGRWHCDNRIGWVWVPGYTWGPSWVSWRYTDDYYGWAPLPPTAHYDGFGFSHYNSHVGIGFDFGLHADFYTFLPSSRFCDRNPHRYYVSGNHSKTIYKNSVVINNYIRGNNNTIINEGIGRDRVSKATRTPVRTVTLRDLPSNSTPMGRAERLEGNSLVVFRPDVTKSGGQGKDRQKKGGVTTLASSDSTTAPSRALSNLKKNDPQRGVQNEVAAQTSESKDRSRSQTAGVVQPSAQVQKANREKETSARINKSSAIEDIVRSNQKERDKGDKNSARIQPQNQPELPRTWSQSTAAIRSPTTVETPRAPSARPETERRDQARVESQPRNGLRDLPSSQNQKERVFTPANNGQQRIANAAPQSITRGEPVLSQRAESIRREPSATGHFKNENAARSHNAPRQQPSYNAPENYNRNSQFQRSVPQAPPQAPQAQHQAPPAQRQAPQVQQSAPQQAPQASSRGSQSSGRNERSNGGSGNGRDKRN